jgi:SAM-dependent methyltransferase
MATDWLLDELAHAGPEHLDPGFVAGYDRKQGADPAPTVQILRRHGLDRASILADLAAGTGSVALAAAPHCRRVIAVDILPAMLGYLWRRAAAAGLANVRCVQAGFLSYRHAGPPADVVHTRNALHQIPDFWKAVALNRIAGMLRPGGVLLVEDLIYDFRPDQAAAVFGRWLDGRVTDPAVGYTRGEIAEHIRTEYSTFRWLFEPMLRATGFKIASADFTEGVYGRYVCRRGGGQAAVRKART